MEGAMESSQQFLNTLAVWLYWRNDKRLKHGKGKLGIDRPASAAADFCRWMGEATPTQIAEFNGILSNPPAR